MEIQKLKINDPKDSSINGLIQKEEKNVPNHILIFIQYFSKRISLILKLLIELLLLFIIFSIHLFFKLKLKLEFLLKDISKRSKNKENINIATSYILKINDNIPIFLENKLKDLQNPLIEWPLPDKIKFKPYMITEELLDLTELFYNLSSLFSHKNILFYY